MKSIFFTCGLLLTFISGSAQYVSSVDIESVNSNLFRIKATSTYKYENATGSPYSDVKFSLAKISGAKDYILVRYNGESDEMEIKNEKVDEKNNENNFFILPKSQEYGTIEYKNGLYIFNLLDYIDSQGKNVNGYLINKFSSNTISLYKKEKIILIKEKAAKNSYDQASPAKLVQAKSEYYLQKNNNQIVEFPNNKKKLISLYPEKKQEIESFLKKNDLSFNDENDLITLTKFISELR